MALLSLNLERRYRSRLALVVVGLNLIFTLGMSAFLYYWPHRDYYGPRGRAFIDRVLIQFHLGAENVVAAWYSSMLLLLVALACLLAYAIDRRSAAKRLDRLLALGWIVMAAAFVVLSLDEIGSLHERIGMMVRLNAASIRPEATTALGWVYVLAIPIGGVALFMLAFGAVRLRHSPAALALLTIGVLLYVSDPFLELLENQLARTSAAMVAERVIEEGLVELGGTTCVLCGVLMYAARRGGSGALAFTLPTRTTRVLAGTLLVAAVPIARAIVARLPAGDVGIAENWFPAAALFALAIGWVGTRRAWGGATLALVLSAYFGAGLFGYAGWYAAIGYNRVAVDMVATAIASALVLSL